MHLEMLDKRLAGEAADGSSRAVDFLALAPTNICNIINCIRLVQTKEASSARRPRCHWSSSAQTQLSCDDGASRHRRQTTSRVSQTAPPSMPIARASARRGSLPHGGNTAKVNFAHLAQAHLPHPDLSANLSASCRPAPCQP